MHLDRIRLSLLLASALVVWGCSAQAPVDSTPAPNRAAVSSPRPTHPELPKPPAAPEQAVAERSTPDAPKVAGAAPPAEVPAAAEAPPKNAEPAVAPTPPSPVSKEPAKPSAEQVAKWHIPEFQKLELLACRDGFGDPAVFGMAISPSGEQFVLSGSKVTLWNIKDAKPAADFLEKTKREEGERPLVAVDISADGKWVAAGDQKGRVRIWSLNDQSETLALNAYPGHITRLAFSPNSQLLATTSYSGEVALWQLPDGKRGKVLKASNEELTHLAFLSDDLLATASNEVNLWNVESGDKVKALTPKEYRATGFVLSQDRKLLAFNDSDTTAALWDVASSQPTRMILRGAGTARGAFSQDGKWLATYSSDLTITIWDVATGNPVQVIDADGDGTSALQWHPRANVLFVASLGGRIRLWGTADEAGKIGIEPMQAPVLPAKAAVAGGPLSSAQLQRVLDTRSLPRLPGATPQWSNFGMGAFSAPVSKEEAALFYRYVLGKAGWSEAPAPEAPDSLKFQKDDCQVNVSITPADASGSKELQLGVYFAGNYDVRKLPKAAPIKSIGNYDSISMVMYRTKASFVDTEVALLRALHEAGWTPYTRLSASSREDPDARHISALQGGNVLTVFVSRPAEATEELAVQTSVAVSTKSLPIPPDAGWIEFDNSMNVQMVVNTKTDLAQTVKYYDEAMAADGWLSREAGRYIKDDTGYLRYIRGQQDVLLRLYARPSGGTRVVVGEAEQTSWQLKPPAETKKAKNKPGIEAADIALPPGAKGVKFDVDEKQIEFEVADTTPPKLGAQVASQMEALGWKRADRGVTSDEYVLITFAKDKAEIHFRARAAEKSAAALIAGDGLLWGKPLPVAPVVISYETWLRRNRKDASLDLLDDFAAEMHKIEAASAPK